MSLDEADLDTLSCEIAKRPTGAPSLEDIAPAIRAHRREGDALVVEFDGAAADTVAEVVAAERLCCAEIGWDLQRDPALQLRIRATPAQLDIFEQFLTRR
jgi:hypothetical protein